MASAGYPESSSTGDVVVGTETLAVETDVDVIHAGTARNRRRGAGHRRRPGARRHAPSAPTSPTPGPRPTRASTPSRSPAPSGAATSPPSRWVSSRAPRSPRSREVTDAATSRSSPTPAAPCAGSPARSPRAWGRPRPARALRTPYDAPVRAAGAAPYLEAGPSSPGTTRSGSTCCGWCATTSAAWWRGCRPGPSAWRPSRATARGCASAASTSGPRSPSGGTTTACPAPGTARDPAGRADRRAVVALVLLGGRRVVRRPLRQPRAGAPPSGVRRGAGAHPRPDRWTSGSTPTAGCGSRTRTSWPPSPAPAASPPSRPTRSARLADRARTELVEPRAWPLDEDWESWRPSAQRPTDP